jgi:hypothetical protein
MADGVDDEGARPTAHARSSQALPVDASPESHAARKILPRSRELVRRCHFWRRWKPPLERAPKSVPFSAVVSADEASGVIERNRIPQPVKHTVINLKHRPIPIPSRVI